MNATVATLAERMAETFPFVRLEEPLAPRTRLGVGGCAEIFAEPPTFEDLRAFVREATAAGLGLRVLGGGTNLLVSDEGVRGAVISLARFNPLRRDGDRVFVGAGVRLQEIVIRSIPWGLSGLHRLAGVPGTVGGAIRMNAGGRYGEIGGFVRSLDVLHPDGGVETIGPDRFGFSYRQGRFPGLCIVGAELELSPGDRFALRAEYDEILCQKRQTQPYHDQSAGCMFKNPTGASAGQLIDQTGLKGSRIGGASVSRVHANFIVTSAEATAEDVFRLADQVQSEVERRFGVRLEREVQAW